MSRLTDLLAQAKARDPRLGADLEREFQALSARLPFGLNFERHAPEIVELPGRPVRKGDKVRLLPQRGSTKPGDKALWRVRKIDRAGQRAELEPARRTDDTRRDETRRDETRRDETRRDETRRDETRRDETRRDETRRDSFYWMT